MSTDLLSKVAAAQTMLPESDPSELPALAAAILDGELVDPGDIAARLDAMHCFADELDREMAYQEERRALRATFDGLIDAQRALAKVQDKMTGLQAEFDRDTKMRGETLAKKMRDLRIELGDAQRAVKACEDAGVSLKNTARKSVRDREQTLARRRLELQQRRTMLQGVAAHNAETVHTALVELGRLLQPGLAHSEKAANWADSNSERNSAWERAGREWIQRHRPTSTETAADAVASWDPHLSADNAEMYRRAVIAVINAESYERKAAADMEALEREHEANEALIAAVKAEKLQP